MKASLKGAGKSIFTSGSQSVGAEGKPQEHSTEATVQNEIKMAGMIRSTFYIRASDDLELEDLKHRLRHEGRKVSKSELVIEAIGLLKEKYSVAKE